MPTGYARIAGEAAPGTEAAAATLSTKKVFIPANEVYITRGLGFMTRDDELRATSEPIPIVPDLNSPSWRLQSHLYPDTLGITLASMWGLSATGETGATHYVTTAGNGVITDPDGNTIPAGVQRHVWTAPLGPSGVTPKTLQLNASYKDEAVYFEARGCATASMSIETPDGGGGAVLSTEGPCLYADSVADPALTPATETVATRPFMRRGLTIVTWLANTATSQDFTINFANPVTPVRSMGSGSAYPDIMEKDEGPVVVTGSIGKRHPDSDDLNALKNGTEFATKTRWQSDTIIASSYPYRFWVECSAAQYTEEDIQALQNRRRHDASFNWRAARNASASVTVTLCTNTASYA